MLSKEMTLNGETDLIKMYPKFNSSFLDVMMLDPKKDENCETIEVL